MTKSEKSTSASVESAMARLRERGNVTREQVETLIALFKRAPVTRERLQAKQQWEHMSMLGVLRDWPAYVEEAQAEITLSAPRPERSET